MAYREHVRIQMTKREKKAEATGEGDDTCCTSSPGVEKTRAHFYAGVRRPMLEWKLPPPFFLFARATWTTDQTAPSQIVALRKRTKCFFRPERGGGLFYEPTGCTLGDKYRVIERFANSNRRRAEIIQTRPWPGLSIRRLFTRWIPLLSLRRPRIVWGVSSESAVSASSSPTQKIDFASARGDFLLLSSSPMRVYSNIWRRCTPRNPISTSKTKTNTRRISPIIIAALHDQKDQRSAWK